MFSQDLHSAPRDPAFEILDLFRCRIGRRNADRLGRLLCINAQVASDAVAPWRCYAREIDTHTMLIVPANAGDLQAYDYVIVGCVRQELTSGLSSWLFDEVRGRRLTGAVLRNTHVTVAHEIVLKKIVRAREQAGRAAASLPHIDVRSELSGDDSDENDAEPRPNDKRKARVPSHQFPVATADENNSIFATRDDISTWLADEPAQSQWRVTLCGILDVRGISVSESLLKCADCYDITNDVIHVQPARFRQDYTRVVDESCAPLALDAIDGGGFDPIDNGSSALSRFVFQGPPPRHVLQKCVDADISSMVMHRIQMYRAAVYYAMDFLTSNAVGVYAQRIERRPETRECIAVTLLCKFLAQTPAVEVFLQEERDLMQRRGLDSECLRDHETNIRNYVQRISSYQGNRFASLARRARIAVEALLQS